jgi:hypothetical protein
MRRHVMPAGITGIIFVGAAILCASVDLETVNPDLRLGISGDAWVESGQFVKYFNNSFELDHAWINRTFMHFNLNAFYKERLHFSFGMEGRMWFNVPKIRGSSQATYVHRPNNFIIISDANASYSFGDSEKPWLALTAGLFPYKYNPEVRNLGEYLFRSGTYPAFLVNTFDLPFARLTGFKISSDLFGMLHQDLIYSMETSIPPFHDGSLTYIAECDIEHFIAIGAGVQFAHLVSVDERITTPEKMLTGNFVNQNNMIVEDGDTSFYTFRGTKLMGKICIDPKKFIPVEIFGKEDLKIYSEAAILGVRSYPANDTDMNIQNRNPWGYSNLKHKIPVVMGLNIPTFKLLNVLAVELEYYGCPYPNSYEKRLGPGSNQSVPLPDPQSNHSSLDHTKDNWKWSVYAKRTFFGDHLGLILQFARDHTRNETVIDESFDYEEALGKGDHWWWMMKLFAQF